MIGGNGNRSLVGGGVYDGFSSKTGAVRVALRERKARLLIAKGGGSRSARMLAVLEGQVWPRLPADVRGSTITREQEDAILGFGPDGV